MKKYLSILILALIVLSCSSIKTNGLYQADKEEDFYQYIRFYKDSIALTVTSTGEPYQLEDWFKKENKEISKGTYTAKNDSIFFTSTSKNGIVIYRGKIKRNKMELYSESRINGFTTTTKYRFKRFK